MAGTEHNLAVYLSSMQIAELTLIDDKLNWHYNVEWQKNGFPLSPNLPLDNAIPSENKYPR